MTNHAPIEELVICRLKTSPQDAAFREALEGTNRWLKQQPGFLWRHSGFSDDGRLIDRCGWTSLVEAEAASGRFMASPEGVAFGQHLAPEDMVFLHYRPEVG